jgi:hypothetical protein
MGYEFYISIDRKKCNQDGICEAETLARVIPRSVVFFLPERGI